MSQGFCCLNQDNTGANKSGRHTQHLLKEAYGEVVEGWELDLHKGSRQCVCAFVPDVECHCEQLGGNIG